MADTILIIDFGSQVTQLIARRLREAGIYTEILPSTAANETILATGSKFNSFTISSLITSTKAAPSLICEEFPAVTLPFAAKTGFSFPSASKEVPFLGP